jgi:hypothetical protein
MSQVIPLQFSSTGRLSNLTMLLRSEHLKGLEETFLLIHEFSVRTNQDDKGASSGIDPLDSETREIMLLVFHLYRLSGSTKRWFRMNKFLTDTITAYYGWRICQRATGDPNTGEEDFMNYQTLTKLLTPKATVHLTLG